MRSFTTTLIACAVVASTVSAIPYQSHGAFEKNKNKRQELYTGRSLQVDLGYEVYQGFHNATSGLNVWEGIRYAAAPTGRMRWQPPQTPTMNRSAVIQANVMPSRCPQAPRAPLAANFNYTTDAYGNEDCLFLNVYAPSNATNLPVFVYIHGGGYGYRFAAQHDPTALIKTNNNGFVAVIIQYRLGAFGFLSSDEVNRFGAVNAGILDQHFALQWVHSYISMFGGDPSRVTIGGESAGGGSVMLQAMAHGGTQRESLFNNVFAASPYLPMQYGYADFVPLQAYYAFAQAAGCFNGKAFGGRNATVFECLLRADSLTLQRANANISASGEYGTWAFVPVTDGRFVQQLPSQQLLTKQVNGLRMLVGNNANEAPPFVPGNIRTQEDFVNYLRATFPLFDEEDIAKLLFYYPAANAPVDPNAPLYATLGDVGPTALNQSTFATGQQQRAYNVYAETTFVCPSYWLAEAYAQNGHSSYKYQYSVPPASHGQDLPGYFTALLPGPLPGADFIRAFMTILGNFIISNNPAIPNSIANGNSSAHPNAANAASTWPQFSSAMPYQMNLNETGGTPTSVPFTATMNVTAYQGPGRMNNFTLVNAYTWEGGRGVRCDFWRSVAPIVPE